MSLSIFLALFVTEQEAESANKQESRLTFENSGSLYIAICATSKTQVETCNTEAQNQLMLKCFCSEEV